MAEYSKCARSLCGALTQCGHLLCKNADVAASCKSCFAASKSSLHLCTTNDFFYFFPPGQNHSKTRRDHRETWNAACVSGEDKAGDFLPWWIIRRVRVIYVLSAVLSRCIFSIFDWFIETCYILFYWIRTSQNIFCRKH